MLRRRARGVICEQAFDGMCRYLLRGFYFAVFAIRVNCREYYRAEYQGQWPRNNHSGYTEKACQAIKLLKAQLSKREIDYWVGRNPKGVPVYPVDANLVELLESAKHECQHPCCEQSAADNRNNAHS